MLLINVTVQTILMGFIFSEQNSTELFVSLQTLFSCFTCIFILMMTLPKHPYGTLSQLLTRSNFLGLSFTLMVNSHYPNIADSLAVIVTVAFWEFQWL